MSIKKTIKKAFGHNGFCPEEQMKETQDRLKESNEYKIDLFYSKNKSCDFSILCDKYGSDKGEVNSENNPYEWPSHSYADLYQLLFGHCRSSLKRVLECGIGTNNPDLVSSMGVNGKPGASLRVWRDYFPNAEIFGVDIDAEILFEEERIKTYQMDQTSSESISEMWSKIEDKSFNLILDDGLHMYHAGISFFENSIAHLADDGMYIIEDVQQVDLIKYTEYFSGKADKYHVKFVNLHRPNSPLLDNSVVIITKSIS